MRIAAVRIISADKPEKVRDTLLKEAVLDECFHSKSKGNIHYLVGISKHADDITVLNKSPAGIAVPVYERRFVLGRDGMEPPTLEATDELVAIPEEFIPQERPQIDISKVLDTVRAQHDPHGKGQHESGAKLDAGKLRMGLVLGGFPNALMEVSRVGTYGANKYTDNGWKEVPDGQRRYADALYRHLFAVHSGETRDPESGILHLAHAAWNALAILELSIKNETAWGAHAKILADRLPPATGDLAMKVEL